MYLIESTNRALEDLNGLNENAVATNPQAVPLIRDVQAQLVAAKAQANQVIAAAERGMLGPTYKTTLQSAYNHLNTASQMIDRVGRAYGAAQFTAANMQGRSGAGGGGRAAGQQSGAQSSR